MIAGLALSAIGTGYSVIQQQSAASIADASARQTGEYNKQIAEYNAVLAEQDADTARKLAQERAAGVYQQSSMHIGAERTILGASGVDLSGLEEGDSALLSFQQTAADYAKNAEVELWNGEEEARGYEQQATIYRTQGNWAQYSGLVDAASYKAQAPSTLGTVLKIGGTGASTLAEFYN
jgi:hypothetical protein